MTMPAGIPLTSARLRLTIRTRPAAYCSRSVTGNLFAALNLPIQQRLAAGHGYPFALAWTVGPALLAVLAVTALGPEAKGTVFGGSAALGAAAAGPAEHANLGSATDGLG
jgi:hypothetical protein